MVGCGDEEGEGLRELVRGTEGKPTDGHRQLASGGQSKSPSPFSETSPRDRRTSPSGESGDYVVQAGKLISQALQFEQDKDYKEALDLFKAGVDVLLNGVQSECSTTNCVWSVLYL